MDDPFRRENVDTPTAIPRLKEVAIPGLKAVAIPGLKEVAHIALQLSIAVLTIHWRSG